MSRKLFFMLLAAASISNPCRADGEPAFERKVDVVYGRKDGTALTMDVFTPPASSTARRLCGSSAAAGSPTTMR